MVSYILQGLGHSAELQVCYALLEILDYVFELCHLLWNFFFYLYFNDCHRAKCSTDRFFHFKLLGEKLLFFLLHLYSLFFELCLECNPLMLCNSAMFYDFALYLLQGLGGLFYFFLCSTKVSFGFICYSTEFSWIISKF